MFFIAPAGLKQKRRRKAKISDQVEVKEAYSMDEICIRFKGFLMSF
jgi:hypothetical protein